MPTDYVLRTRTSDLNGLDLWFGFTDRARSRIERATCTPIDSGTERTSNQQASS